MNVDFAECIKAKDHFGYTKYHNICNGEVETLAWTILDWIAAVIIFGFGALLMLMVVFAVRYMFKAVTEDFF